MNKTFITFDNRVKKKYCDRNDHLNIAYYMMYYSDATFNFLDEIGLTENYKILNKLTAVVSNSFTVYKKELYCYDLFRIETNIVYSDYSYIVIIHKIKRSDVLINKCYMRLDFINTLSRTKSDIPTEIIHNGNMYFLKGVKNIFDKL